MTFEFCDYHSSEKRRERSRSWLFFSFLCYPLPFLRRSARRAKPVTYRSIDKNLDARVLRVERKKKENNKKEIIRVRKKKRNEVGFVHLSFFFCLFLSSILVNIPSYRDYVHIYCRLGRSPRFRSVQNRKCKFEFTFLFFCLIIFLFCFINFI